MRKKQILFESQLAIFASIAFLVMFLILPLTAFAQKPLKTRSMMWQVKSGKNTAYLLGSIHLGSKELYPLPKEIEDAFESSSKLLVEVDINKIDASKMQMLVQSGGFYAGDDTLWKHLNEATAERLRKFLVAYNVPPEAFAKIKPWLAAVQIALLPSLKSGSQASLGIDQYFLNKAKDKKPIEQLESAESQLQIFISQPDDAQVQYLIATLDQLEKKPNYLAEIEQVWLRGDDARLDDILTETFREPVALQRNLREERNPQMAEAIEKCLKNGETCFMVVGAAHVIGREGIINILKKKGYKTKQVIVTPAINNNGKKITVKK